MLYLKNITVKKNNQNILSSINLTIKKGDKILIVGESGGGKSTLLRSILFFETDISGNIFWKNEKIDEKIDEKNIDKYRKRFAYVDQKPPFFEGTVKEYFHLPFTLKYNNQHKNLKAVENLNLQKKYLNQLSINTSILEKTYEKLSGGEKQRVNLIQFLLLDKEVYLLDEVTSSLDTENIERVINMINGKKDRTIICVSHNMQWERWANRKFIMNNGRLLEVPIK